MPDIRLCCEKCNSERFEVSTYLLNTNSVLSLTCKICNYPADVDRMVSFSEETYLYFLPPVPDPIITRNQLL